MIRMCLRKVCDNRLFITGGSLCECLEGTHEEGNLMRIWEQTTTRDNVESLEKMALFVQRMYHFAITNSDSKDKFCMAIASAAFD